MIDSNLLIPFFVAIGISLFAGPMGCFVVWRRLSYFGDTLAHAAILGVAMSLLLGFNMSVSVLVVALVITFMLYIFERRLLVARDALLGLISHCTLAIGLVVLAAIGGAGDHDSHGGHDDHAIHEVHEEHDDHEGHDHGDHDDHDDHEGHDHDEHGHDDHDDHAAHADDDAYHHEGGMSHGHEFEALIFGDILSAGLFELFLVYLGGGIVLLGLLLIWRRLFASTVSPEIAASEGCEPDRTNLLYVLLLALAVALTFQLVGALLIIALLIIPAVTARSFSGSPERMAVISSLVGALSVILGFVTSIYAGTPFGPTIVVAASALFFLGLIVAAVMGRSRHGS